MRNFLTAVGAAAALAWAAQRLQEAIGSAHAPITGLIVAVTSATSWWAWRRPDVAQSLLFDPLAITAQRENYRFLTHALVHGGVWHLVFNMVALWSFGTVAEQVVAQLMPHTGAALYLAFYVSAVAVASWPSYRRHRHDPTFISVGASGGVSAVVAFAILVDPAATVYVYVIPMPGWLFLAAFMGVSALLARRPNSHIDHLAHLAGAMYGVAVLVTLGAAFQFNVLLHLVEGIVGVALTR